MADVRMIARLADLPEFGELKKYIDEREENDVQQLARKTYKLPEGHDQGEWEKLKAHYSGARQVLELPFHARATQSSNRKESQ